MASIVFGLAGLLMGTACTRYEEDHPVFRYYPPSNVLDDGYVNKYYEHYYPDDPNRSAGTSIVYIKEMRLPSGELVNEYYNAGFALSGSRRYAIDQAEVSVIYESDVRTYLKTDTVVSEIVKSNFKVWGGDATDAYQSKFDYENEPYLLTKNQLSQYDSTILGHPAKVFEIASDIRREGSDSTFNESVAKEYFVQDFGFFGSDQLRDGYMLRTELVEQMSLEEFKRRAAHGEHRVAWIDKDQSMSDDTDFELCGHEIDIADYYNSTPQGTYVHNKRAMLDTIEAHLDKAKLAGPSGMLTFRFVVNCEGKVGRFIVQGYDQAYQKTTFNQETVDHLFGIIQRLEEWQPVVIRDQPMDAYFYITFKLKDGEITDILP
ncbi:MAG: hypothetical protein AAGC88_07290 [Bacteroidota bacterium]